MFSKVGENLTRIKNTLETLKQTHNLLQPVTLIAVSKFHSAESILAAYETGHRDFGENYIDELVLKSQSLPLDIKWHMIGHVQSNKLNKLLSIPNLSSIHTIDTATLANKIQAKLTEKHRELDVFLQINTSGEASKSGISPAKLREMFVHITENCKSLKLKGLMTIGERGNSDDFVILNQCRQDLINHLSSSPPSIELSMGMSGDYQEALLHGSNYIRIGTSIFGVRQR